MLKRLFRVDGALVWAGILFIAAPALGETSFSEVYVQSHRCLVSEPADLPPGAPVVVILHGSKSSADAMIALADQLYIPPCRIVLPDGPLPLGRFGGAHFWYGRFTHSRKDVEYSRDYLFDVMNHFSHDPSNSSGRAEPPKPRPVIIMGVSQGAVMALEAGLNYKGNIKAVVSLSGYIANPEKTLAHPSAPLNTPILLVHGTWDPIVQNEDTEGTLRALKRAGYHPVLREFQIGHVLTYGTTMAVTGFLQDVMSQNPRKRFK